MTEIELDPTLLVTLQTLESSAVEFVLVGEVAEAVHDGGGFISHVAIVPGGYGRNVDRLGSALKKLGAHLANGQPIDQHTTDLRQLAPCTLHTQYADLELNFAPGGTNGYADLFDDAGRVRLASGVSPHVASPADLERIERWARASQGVPPAVAPPQPPPEPAPHDGLWEIPPARTPARLPPEPNEPVGDRPDEIRASRAPHRPGSSSRITRA